MVNQLEYAGLTILRHGLACRRPGCYMSGETEGVYYIYTTKR